METFEVEREIEAELQYGPTLDSVRLTLENYYQHMETLKSLYEQAGIDNEAIRVRFQQASELLRLAQQ